MCDNYPQGMTRRDLWYLGEVPDSYGNYVGHGFAYNSDEYDRDLDDWADDEEEDDSDDFL